MHEYEATPAVCATPMDESYPLPHVKGLNTSLLCNRHLDTSSHCMSCWVCWECLLSVWTIVLSFFKAADHALLQVVSSLLLPVGGKSTFGNT